MKVRYLNLDVDRPNYPLVKSALDSIPPKRKRLSVFLQTEHSLVLPGGRGLGTDDPLGTVSSIFDPNVKYHVRIANRSLYSTSDLVIEYSRQNIEHIKTSGVLRPEELRKIVYGPSIPFDYHHGRTRILPVISNFVREDEPRRAEMMKKIAHASPDYRNIQGIFRLEDLQNLYASTQVLVNVHQTWHHHTIEEFRILPALSRGCIVISEKVPLRHAIPYHKYIVWCSYDDMPEVIRDVTRNYTSYFERIHGSESGLEELLESMKDECRRSLEAAVSDTEVGSPRAGPRRTWRGG